MSDKILKGVEQYYTNKIREHGNSSLGVDWNSTESQYLRFDQLCKLITASGHFHLIDYGSGYGELVNYLSKRFGKAGFQYTGYDVSHKMIEQGLHLFKH